MRTTVVEAIKRNHVVAALRAGIWQTKGLCRHAHHCSRFVYHMRHDVETSLRSLWPVIRRRPMIRKSDTAGSGWSSGGRLVSLSFVLAEKPLMKAISSLTASGEGEVDQQI